jgi:hypothetical protein
MPAQFRMPQEDPTTGAQPRLPGGDQPQGMFAHRSRGQHSLNQVTHTFVTVGHLLEPASHPYTRSTTGNSICYVNYIGPPLIYFRYHGCIPRLYPVKDAQIWEI